MVSLLGVEVMLGTEVTVLQLQAVFLDLYPLFRHIWQDTYILVKAIFCFS